MPHRLPSLLVLVFVPGLNKVVGGSARWLVLGPLPAIHPVASPPGKPEATPKPTPPGKPEATPKLPVTPKPTPQGPAKSPPGKPETPPGKPETPTP